MRIPGKNIVITGGAKGLGKQFLIDLKNSGARVFAVDILEAELESVHREYQINVKKLDVTNEPEVEDFFENYTYEYGAPHVLINCADVTRDGFLVTKQYDMIRRFSFSDWKKVIDVNLTGAFLCSRAAAAQMMRFDLKGLIINISSVSRNGNVCQSNYSASKAGLSAMTVTWAKELSKYGIRSVAIAPGYLHYDKELSIDPEDFEKIRSQIPLGRLGELKEVSQAVRFVIECEYYNGKVLEIDGGYRM